MSKANRRIAAIVIASLAAGLMILGPARSDTDPLKDAAARKKVASEQAERDIRELRDAANKLAATQPTQAMDQLNKLLDFLKANEDLTEAQRQSLALLLQRDIATARKIADNLSNPNLGSGFHPAAPDPRAEEQKQIIDRAMSRITSAKDALADAADIRAKKSEAIRGLLAQVDRSDIPDDRPYVLPSNWAELSKQHLKNNMLTETERAILKALSATVSVDFKDQHFSGVVDWFQHQTGQTIVLDKTALDDAGVNNESTINVTLNKVTTRTALKKVLADLGLTYVIKDESIFVTTPAKAKDMMTVRTYYIGDLVGGYDVGFNGALSQYQALAAVAQLVQMVQNNIDPDSWAANGKDGGGTIVFDPIHMALIVKQSAEIHYKMMEGLIPH